MYNPCIKEYTVLILVEYISDSLNLSEPSSYSNQEDQE